MTYPILRGTNNPKFKHGKSRTREYDIWQSMKQRVLCPTNHAYARYGGRGILICGRWLDFANFLSDMGPCPSHCSLDRINNDGPYEKNNCRWATRIEQNSNTRKNRYWEHQGERLTHAEWARRVGITPMTLWKRLHRGWSVEDAMTTPENPHLRLLTCNGQTQMLADWARQLRVPPCTLQMRLKRGWSVERAVTTPRLEPGKYERARH